MAYANPFPVNYQPIYPQYPQPQPVQQMPQPQPSASPAMQHGINSNLIWVQGEAGAKSYLVAPNTTVQLWDSESQTIYLKSADGSGMPSMKILDYKIREAQPQQIPITQPVAESSAPSPKAPDYVTHEELQAFRDEVKSMIKVPAQKKGVAKDE